MAEIERICKTCDHHNARGGKCRLTNAPTDLYGTCSKWLVRDKRINYGYRSPEDRRALCLARREETSGAVALLNLKPAEMQEDHFWIIVDAIYTGSIQSARNNNVNEATVKSLIKVNPQLVATLKHITHHIAAGEASKVTVAALRHIQHAMQDPEFSLKGKEATATVKNIGILTQAASMANKMMQPKKDDKPAPKRVEWAKLGEVIDVDVTELSKERKDLPEEKLDEPDDLPVEDEKPKEGDKE